MLISLNWLKEFVDVSVDVTTLADRLTLAGSEVERIHEQDVDFEGVVVAEVKSLRPLPGSTKNQIAAVTTGGAHTEVVTGAWNLAVGDRVPYAVPGARLRDRRIETNENILQKVMRHRAGCDDLFNFQRNGIGFVNAHPNREDPTSGGLL